MVDTVTKDVRSRMMASIGGKNTKPELVVRRWLHAKGFRFRIHRRVGRSRPDLVLARYRAAVFVNGCFWHGHPGCRYSRLPKSNGDFWTPKIAGNRLRDAGNLAELAALGWRTAVVWECALRSANREETLISLSRWITSDDPSIEIGETPPLSAQQAKP